MVVQNMQLLSQCFRFGTLLSTSRDLVMKLLIYIIISPRRSSLGYKYLFVLTELSLVNINEVKKCKKKEKTNVLGFESRI